MGSRTTKGSALDKTEAAAAKSPDAVAAEALGQDHGGDAPMPSFKPIGPMPMGHRVAPARAPTATGATAAAARRSASAPGAIRSPLPLWLAAIFATGVAAGFGGAYLAPLGLPWATSGIREIQEHLFGRQSRDGVPVAALSSGNGSGDAASTPATTVGRERRNEPGRLSVAAPARENVAPPIAPTPTVPAEDPALASTGPPPLDSATANGQSPKAAREAQPSAPFARAEPAATAPPEMGATAMARASEAMARGDIVTARRFYELAFSSGMPGAARGVGSTYDPTVLKETGVAGLKGDAEAAKRWYEKAIAAGDAQAKPRLAKLLSRSVAR